MNVKYVATTASKLSQLSIVNGQLVYLTDRNASYYDMDGERRLLTGVRVVSALPAAANAQVGVLYCIINADGTVSASIYDSTESEFAGIAGIKATSSSIGAVKPDGVTLTVDADGMLTVSALPSTYITYDHTASQLSATNVQDAIDEVNTAVTNAATVASNASTAAAAASTLASTALSTAQAATTALANKQDTLTAGAGIKISGSTIKSGEYFGTATGQSANQVKAVVVSSDQNFQLEQGVVINVKFDGDNTCISTTAAPIQINVNDTGAKAIYYRDTGTPTGTISAAFGKTNYYNQYFYDGTYWVWQGTSGQTSGGGGSASTPADLGFGYGTCSTAEGTTEKACSVVDYVLTTGGFVTIKFANAVDAGATLNINGEGAKAAYYRGAAITAGIIEAGDTATFVYDGANYHLLAVDSLIARALVTES